MAKRWKIRGIDSGLVRSISSSARLPELVAALLVGRGVQTPDAAKAFLDANLRDNFRNPSQMPGCEAVAQALYKAVRDGKRIAVFGDYDVDGFTSAVILCKTLKDFGARDVRYYIPCRLDEGYGLNPEAIKTLKNEGWDTIVTVDNGISCLDEVRLGKELGLEMLVTDHHIPGPELPEADAIAHPQLVRFPAKDGSLVSEASLTEAQRTEAKRYPFPPLCGGGVALKVALRLNDIVVKNAGRPLSQERIREFLVLSTLATIADCVPLLDENRALVRSGLAILNTGPVSPGVNALLEIAKGKKSNVQVDEEFIAFQMAPRLNAAGRLGQAGLAAELLWNEDRCRCAELAAEIDKLNQDRKKLESEMQSEAEKQISEKFHPEDVAFVLDGLGWHRGVLGIVASRIAEHYHRPTILLARSLAGKVVGSGRGAGRGEAFDLYEAIKSCEDLLVRFGGHNSAAGLTIKADKIDEFRKRFVKYAEENVSEEDRTAELFLDGEFPLGAFTPSAVGQISLLAPFGNENTKPVFAARNVTPQNIRTMGKDASHFEADFRQGGVSLRGIAFGRKDWVEEMQAEAGPIDIAFKVRISTFGANYGQVELDILDWRTSNE